MTIDGVVSIMLALTGMYVLSTIFQKNNKAKQEKDNLPGYDKFLEESRDAAFDYIETVQESLNVYMYEVEPLLDKFSKNNSKLTKAAYVEAMNQIKDSTDKLRAELPEDQ